jgi:WhiB family redox-sensing transcriptional regulator
MNVVHNFSTVANPLDSAAWRSDAACHGDMGAAFYPPLRPEMRAAKLSRESRAKAVCALCPVRHECLEQALASRERFGIWGGLTGTERTHLRAV